jgi:hypothetical protein
MYYEIPLPITCGICGLVAGVISGGCSQTVPIWIGAIIGTSLGCVGSIFLALKPEAETPVVAPNPVVVENVYLSGEEKASVAKDEVL